ncbi:HU family DNA-binding protein [uncultured Bacteroides sp.]|uniref:HU family DNA-binding protein n=1 Tax=uncultured Bacteroides sp. TaxID=162156 RepID=UPI002AAB303F|nr:HU family DNA-binding protein [uncultured Bacteroides sp.]
MNNKEFITELSNRLGYSAKETSDLVSSAISVVSEQLQEENAVIVQGFGTFEVKKKLERISVNPATKQRMLVPPKLVINFKPSNVIKDKFK